MVGMVGLVVVVQIRELRVLVLLDKVSKAAETQALPEAHPPGVVVHQHKVLILQEQLQLVPLVVLAQFRALRVVLLRMPVAVAVAESLLVALVVPALVEPVERGLQMEVVQTQIRGAEEEELVIMLAAVQ